MPPARDGAGVTATGSAHFHGCNWKVMLSRCGLVGLEAVSLRKQMENIVIGVLSLAVLWATSCTKLDYIYSHFIKCAWFLGSNTLCLVHWPRQTNDILKHICILFFRLKMPKYPKMPLELSHSLLLEWKRCNVILWWVISQAMCDIT